MRITRYIHSCVVVEDAGSAVLIDPGYYSWESGLIEISKLPDLSEIAITHEHADHFHPQFVLELLERFPELVIVTTPAVKAKLAELGITASVTIDSTESITVFQTPHNNLPPGLGDAPQNIGVHVFGKLTHPGDSHTFTETKDILALPITAPWGSVTGAVDAALAVKPSAVLPIHDWHWHEAARTTMYANLSKALPELGMRFITPIDGEAVEI